MSHEPSNKAGPLGRGRAIAVGVGVAGCLALVLFGDLDPGRPEVTRTAAMAILMGLLWITEAIPLAVTSLLPVFLLPALGVSDGKVVASHYFNHVVFLFIGGFVVALAMERWQLHRRIALRILLLFGTHPRRILLGFMVATAFLSMWISNTAATMMMVTIALAIITKVEGASHDGSASGFAKALLFGVAYGATLGGIATLVGTPPNLSFARIFEIQFPDAPEISFASWFLFTSPVSLLFTLLVWMFLSLVYLPKKSAIHLDETLIRREYDSLGKMSFAEWVVLIDFLLLVTLWVFRKDVVLGDWSIPGWGDLFPKAKYLNDGAVAIAMAVPLFALPARDGRGSRVMDWPTAARLPWNIILLFGGGFALAGAFGESGLSDWMGRTLSQTQELNPFVLIALMCLALTFLTELTSNLATTEMILPVLGGLSRAIEVNPLFLMIPATLSCSCAFMMPVATPPNAIVFGSERLRIVDMVKTGLLLNFVGVALIVGAVALLGGALWDIDLDVFPEWAKSK